MLLFYTGAWSGIVLEICKVLMCCFYTLCYWRDQTHQISATTVYFTKLSWKFCTQVTFLWRGERSIFCYCFSKIIKLNTVIKPTLLFPIHYSKVGQEKHIQNYENIEISSPWLLPFSYCHAEVWWTMNLHCKLMFDFMLHTSTRIAQVIMYYIKPRGVKPLRWGWGRGCKRISLWRRGSCKKSIEG